MRGGMGVLILQSVDATAAGNTYMHSFEFHV